jgi:nitroreductase
MIPTKPTQGKRIDVEQQLAITQTGSNPVTTAIIHLKYKDMRTYLVITNEYNDLFHIIGEVAAKSQQLIDNLIILANVIKKNRNTEKDERQRKQQMLHTHVQTLNLEFEMWKKNIKIAEEHLPKTTINKIWQFYNVPSNRNKQFWRFLHNGYDSEFWSKFGIQYQIRTHYQKELDEFFNSIPSELELEELPTPELLPLVNTYMPFFEGAFSLGYMDLDIPFLM